MAGVDEVVRALSRGPLQEPLVAVLLRVHENRKHVITRRATDGRCNSVRNSRGSRLGAVVVEPLVDRLGKPELVGSSPKAAVHLSHRELHCVSSDTDAHVGTDVVQELRLVVHHSEDSLLVYLGALSAVKILEALALHTPSSHDVERREVNRLRLVAEHRVLTEAVELVYVATKALALAVRGACHVHRLLLDEVGVALLTEILELHVESPSEPP